MTWEIIGSNASSLDLSLDVSDFFNKFCELFPVSDIKLEFRIIKRLSTRITKMRNVDF